VTNEDKRAGLTRLINLNDIGVIFFFDSDILYNLGFLYFLFLSFSLRVLSLDLFLDLRLLNLSFTLLAFSGVESSCLLTEAGFFFLRLFFFNNLLLLSLGCFISSLPFFFGKGLLVEPVQDVRRVHTVLRVMLKHEQHLVLVGSVFNNEKFGVFTFGRQCKFFLFFFFLLFL